MKTPILCFGDDEFAVTSAAKALVAQLVPPTQEAFGLEIVDGRTESVEQARAAIDRCAEALQTIGFFNSQKVVWLRDAGFLGDSQASRAESVKEKLKDLCALIVSGLAPGQVLIVTAEKVDKRSVFYKVFAEHGQVQEYSVPEKARSARDQARKRLEDCFRKDGLKARSEILEAILDKAGTDTRQLDNEAEKLALALGDRKDVQEADVQAIVSPSREVPVWDLADAAGKRNLGGALTVLRQLLFQKVTATWIISGLATRFRELLLYEAALKNGWLAKTGGGYEWSEVPPDVASVFSEAFDRDPRKIHPFRVGLLVAQSQNFKRHELQRSQDLILQAYEDLMSSSLPERLILEILLIKILRRPDRNPHS